MSRFYCTYFDRNYLTRGLAMHASLRRFDPNLILEVLCLDQATYDLLRRLDLLGVRLMGLAELERADPALLTAKGNRPWPEYIWTLTPSLIQFCLMRNPDADLVTYLDADLLFLDSPAAVFAELGEGSISLMPHRFAGNVAAFTRNNGVYNVAMMSFRHDPIASSVLGWWRERVFEACLAQPKDGRFGDQKYLDDWPERFTGVRVIEHIGADLAPWNLANYTITRRDGRLWVDDRPVIFYHYHRFFLLNERWFRSDLRISRANIDLLYRPYVAALREAMVLVRTIEPTFAHGIRKLDLLTVYRCLRYRRFTFFRDEPAALQRCAVLPRSNCG